MTRETRIPRLVAIIPSLGLSPWMKEALAALRRELAAAPGDHELVWVHQGPEAPPGILVNGEQLVRIAEPAGFAVAVNRGMAAVRHPFDFLLLLNDDVVLESGWLSQLLTQLAVEPDLGSVQGMNLRLAEPARIDGCGLAWTRDWQAVQIYDGFAAEASGDLPFEIFGVSATAALYRRTALDAVSAVEGAGGHPFAERLESYYEDVELAVRLRAAGFASRCVPAARALHAGQATSRRAPARRWRAIYRNRRRVARALLGDRFAQELPRIRARDRRDLVRRFLAFDLHAVRGIVAGLRDSRNAPTEHAAQPLPSTARALAAAERLAVGSFV